MKNISQRMKQVMLAERRDRLSTVRMAGTEKDVGHCLQTSSSLKAVPRGKPGAISKHGWELPKEKARSGSPELLPPI